MDGCTECGEPLLWGGMGWVPHSERQHAAARRRLRLHLARKLQARAAVRAGHHVTIRFTAEWSWFECACGNRGQLRCDSHYSRGDAFAHLIAG